METLKGYTLTTEETTACLELIAKMREERAREQAIMAHKQAFEDLTIATIDAIGLEETKRIVRGIHTALRSKEK